MTLEKKVPPIIVVAIAAFVMWALASLTPSLTVALSIRMALILLLLVAGLFILVSAVRTLTSAHTTLDPTKPEETTSLVSSGIFKVSRNPIYLGFAFLLLAWGIHLSSLWSLLGVVAFVLYLDWFQIRPEERELTVLFGEEYKAYRARTRRWL